MKIPPLFFILFIPFPVFAQEADTLYLSQCIHPIEEVVVTGSKAEVSSRILSSTVTVVRREEIENSNRISLLPTLAESVPGLFVTSRGVMGYGVSAGAAGGMTIRGVGGAPTTGVMVLLDGHPQYMGLMGHPIADSYQSFLAERVEVVRGPASALYGSNAMGGVINIITRREKPQGLQTDANIAYGSYNTLHTNLTNRVNYRRFTSTITGGYDRSDGHRVNMGFEQYGGLARVGVALSASWELAAMLNLTHFNGSNPGTITAPINDNDSRITRATSSVSLRNNYERVQGAVSLFYNWGRHKINDGYRGDSAPLDYLFVSQDRQLGTSVYQTFSLFANNRITLGGDYQAVGGEAANHYTNNELQPIADKYIYNAAAYITLQQGISRWLMIDAALRYDYNSDVGGVWVPQGGVSISLPRNIQLKGVISKGFRFPTIREMYMFPSQNPELQPEQIINYEFSFSQRLRSVRYGLNIFYIDGRNLIQMLMVDGRPQNVNTGAIENFGVEADVMWQVGRCWQVASNYSYLNMAHPVVAAPKHKLFFALRFQHKRWNITTDVQHVAGLITQLEPLSRQKYTLWNANMEFAASQRLRLYLRAENLLAEEYEINAGYPMPRTTVNVGVKFIL